MTTILEPYPVYKDSGVEWLGRVPEHWEEPRLRYVTSCLDGRRVPLNAVERGSMQGPYPYWGANKIIDYINDYLFDEPLVLLGEDGAPFFGANKEVAFFVEGKIWVNNHAHVIRCKGRVQPRYLVHVLNLTDYTQFVDGSTRDKLTQQAMGSIPVILPRLEEQTAIVRFLDYVDRRIRRYTRAKQKLIKLLEEYKQALIHQAVTGQMDVRTGKPYPAYKDSGVEWLGQVPEHWEVRRLKNICRFVYGDALPDASRKDGTIPVYGSNGSVGFHTVPNTLAPCIVIGRKGSFGKVQYCDAPVFSIDTTFFVDNRFTSAHLRWLFFAINWLRLDEVSKDSAIPGLDREDAYKRLLPLPPLPEQTAIVAYLDAQTAKLDAAIAATRREIELLREYRERLIADVVTGKVDVREVAAQLPEEPAEDEKAIDEPTGETDDTVESFEESADEAVEE